MLANRKIEEDFDLYKILNEKNAMIIDVRTKAEFLSGNVKNSINIPVDQVVNSIDEIKSMPKPVVLCCASGSRSAMAVDYLIKMGVDNLYDGGSWKNVEMQLIGK